ncbi:Substrate-binding region of ABC-type glycine betaine transport system [Desulforamulus reducens MI-1]|uniref:Substrate-binding region of ABC-type glycine betaine transport system n=1 Tax=Desulforamulus reducens (strain ATCC BAA-1160 / DSM 100696 / MI-1) TaxID=349161 RepID=A4J9F6_DESRM|nr:glycine betaine ABC transporter substrate-binding protein [Desulforamulus reducens]ABO51709.1 Substrate-binding region of ABC-type glycine betaine transport system [Desulforamulus reducens MI-1]
MKRTRWYLLVVGLLISLLAVGCGGGGTESKQSGTVGDQVKHKIIGIDPGAGLMKATDKAIQEYELKDWEVVEGSSAAMTAALAKAYENKEPIIVTGWTPHWKFAKYDLKYLEDPKKVYGDAEFIHTIVRKGLKGDHPSAYKLLDNFNWQPADMESVMVAMQEGKEPAAAAKDWIKNNEETVNKWLEGISTVQGDKITLAYVAWDSEIASTNVVAIALEKLGYEVELSQVEAGPMWAGLASGDADAIVAAWLPTTHADYYKEFEGKFEDLGPNLEGTRIGLVVPAYMDINSIEDLNK